MCVALLYYTQLCKPQHRTAAPLKFHANSKKSAMKYKFTAATVVRITTDSLAYTYCNRHTVL